MRLQDWFADHFGGQYAVPRRTTKKKEPSQLLWFIVEFAKTTAIAVVAGMYLFTVAIKLLTPKRGQPPVALIMLAALLSTGAGMMFAFMF